MKAPWSLHPYFETRDGQLIVSWFPGHGGEVFLVERVGAKLSPVGWFGREGRR